MDVVSMKELMTYWTFSLWNRHFT